MQLKLLTDKTVTEAAAALQIAVLTNHFGGRQFYRFQESIWNEDEAFADERCWIFKDYQPQQDKKALERVPVTTGAYQEEQMTTAGSALRSSRP